MESLKILDQSTARKANLLTRAYSHDIRIKMLELLKVNKELCVSHFYEDDNCIDYLGVRMEQSITSQHLAILRKAGLVKTERDGKFIYYSLSDEFADISTTLATVAGYFEKTEMKAAA